MSTRRQSEPPAGIERAGWLALVLTVKGIVVCAPKAPKVVVHVLPPPGIVATKPAQLAVADTPTLKVTCDRGIGPAGVQYIVNDQTPAATVCAGRPVKENTAT